MKATKAEILQRVDEILRIRIDGAMFHDVRQYVAEKQKANEAPWIIPEDGKPLSERTLWRYLKQADDLMAQSSREGRKRAFRRHLVQRRTLYARAVNASDHRAALACLADEAKLLGLYPASKTELTGKGGKGVAIQIIEIVRGADHGDGQADGDHAGGAPEVLLPLGAAARLGLD